MAETCSREIVLINTISFFWPDDGRVTAETCSREIVLINTISLLT